MGCGCAAQISDRDVIIQLFTHARDGPCMAAGVSRSDDEGRHQMLHVVLQDQYRRVSGNVHNRVETLHVQPARLLPVQFRLITHCTTAEVACSAVSGYSSIASPEQGGELTRNSAASSRNGVACHLAARDMLALLAVAPPMSRGTTRSSKLMDGHSPIFDGVVSRSACLPMVVEQWQDV